MLKRPSPKRIDARARTSSTPSARRTCDDSWRSELHAAPEETATSLSPVSNCSPFTPSTLTLRLWGSRDAIDPFTVTPLSDVCSLSHSRSRSPRKRTASPAISSRQMSAARPKPTMAGTFRVPDRRPASCPPPSISGATATPRRTNRAPTPFGP